MDQQPRILVVVPTYNERENLQPLVAELLALRPGLSVLVVDDHSPDGTGQVADELAAADDRVQVMHRPAKLGLGSAYREAFVWALARSDAELICQMDADFSHPPRAILQMVELLINGQADVAVGSRYVPGADFSCWGRGRLMLSRLANAYARTITGLPQRDATAGFKCFRRAVLEAIDLSRVSSNGYGFQVEMSYHAFKRGFVIREIPIAFVDRRHGRSKLDRRVVLEAVALMWKLRWRAARGRIAPPPVATDLRKRTQV